MLFGLTNISATFQLYINKSLTKNLNVYIIVYLDNIPIYTNKKET